jgi:diguanylate cyclase (GGDEF)-like protein/PAS domain S-box-containing protein
MNQINENISSIINRNLVICSPEDTISNCAHIMQKNGCSSILVMENNVPIGIWTERDSLRLDISSLAIFDHPVRDFMRFPVKSILEDISIGAAAVRFKEEKVRHLLVVNANDKPVGIITQTDVIIKHGEEYYLTLKNVNDAISSTPTIINEDTSFADALTHIEKSTESAILVAFHDGSFGIVTEKDITRRVAERHFPNVIGEVASRPLITIDESANLLEARNRLIEATVRHLGVKNANNELVGLISYSSILSSLQFEYVRHINTILEERGRALKKTQNNLHLAHKIIEASLDGIIIVNSKGLIEYVNPTFSLITGYSAEEAVGKPPRLLKSGRHDRIYYQDMWQNVQNDGYWQGEIWNRRKNGEVYPEWLTITAIKDDLGNIMQYAGIFCDISERKSQETEIRRLAYFDELTQLPNRRLFSDRLNMALARAKRHKERLAVMFVDLDHFKKINDTLGHTTGDNILIEAALRLSHCTRSEDTVARLGGDEFILLFPEIESIEEVTKVAERIIHSFSQHFDHNENKLFVTTSLGISIFPEDGEDAETLIKNADVAMYRSKDEGRSRYNLFNSSFNQEGMQELLIEAALRNAVQNNEFELYYQPQATAKDGTLIAAEALLRWKNKEFGDIGPANFIPIAEEIGLISKIGEWVLKQACAQIKEWLEKGYAPILIAINIAPEQITDQRFPQLVQDTLNQYGLDGSSLEIEITEGSFIQHPDEVSANLFALKKLGIRIAIDDFGTGYSNLSYLRKLPIDHLKIDQSFIRELFDNLSNQSLISTIINMSQNLGLKSIAEGVETQSQADFLSAGGCSILQGYLYSKPEPAALFERHFKQAKLQVAE